MLSTAMLWKTLRWTREIIRTDLNREWVSSVEPKLIDLWGARMFEWLMLHIITNQHPKVVIKWSVWFCLATPEHNRKSTDATLPYTDFALRSRSGGESAALLVLEGSHDEVVTWQLWPSIFGSLGKNCQHTHNLSGITEFSSFLELLSPCTLSSTPYPQECLDLWKLKLYIYIYIYTPFLRSRDVRVDVHASQPGGTKAAQRQELNLDGSGRLETDGLKLLRFPMSNAAWNFEC